MLKYFDIPLIFSLLANNISKNDQLHGHLVFTRMINILHSRITDIPNLLESPATLYSAMRVSLELHKDVTYFNNCHAMLSRRTNVQRL